MATQVHLPLGFYAIAVGFVAAVAGGAVTAGFRAVDRLVDRWAAVHGLVLDGDARALVAHRIGVGRRIRTVGFVVGYCAPLSIALILGNPAFFLRSLLPVHWWNLGGYFAGALIAEAWFAHNASRGGVAVLAPRTLRDYLAPGPRLAPRVVAAVAVVVAVAYTLVPLRQTGGTRGEQLARRFFVGTSTDVWIAASFVVGIVIVVEVLQRAVVRRRQRFASETQVLADDSLRAWSLRILGWMSITVALSALTWMLIPLGFKTGLISFRDGSFDAAYLTVYFGPLVVAAVAFRWLSRPFAPWQVRRTPLVHPA